MSHDVVLTRAPRSLRAMTETTRSSADPLDIAVIGGDGIGPEVTDQAAAVLQAALATAVLGTLLNDRGSSASLTGTGMVAITVGWFCLDHALRDGWPSPAPGRELWTWLGRGSARR